MGDRNRVAQWVWVGSEDLGFRPNLDEARSECLEHSDSDTDAEWEEEVLQNFESQKSEPKYAEAKISWSGPLGHN